MQAYDIPTPTVKDPSKLIETKLTVTYTYDVSTRAGESYTFTIK